MEERESMNHPQGLPPETKVSGQDCLSEIGRSDDATGPSNKRGTKLCDGVYSLHEPGGRPEMEIVFIHGLQLCDSKDAYWTTWLARDESKDNCWPKTWLADKFPKARILSVSYDTDDLVFKSQPLGPWDFFRCGETLVQEMAVISKIGQNGCPVVFVCHCIGGLVIKQVIVLAHEKFRNNKKICNLLCNTRAFIFYSTPHGGSQLVKMTDEIGRLNSSFENIRQRVFNSKWEIFVVAGTHATPSMWLQSKKIVKEHSTRYIGSDRVVQVATDHFDVCKPITRTDTSFLMLTEWILEVVGKHKRNPAKMLKSPSCTKRIADKLPILCKKLEMNPIVGLVGGGGVGKTTLSIVMYNLELEHYERCSYLKDVKSHIDMVQLQKQLLQELCGESWDENGDEHAYLERIQQCIQTQKVLVVIDDARTKENLNALHVLAFKNGSSGSKLVITCRSGAILSDYISDRQMIELDSHLKSLTKYTLDGPSSVTEFQSEVDNLEALLTLRVAHWPGFIRLPTEIGKLTNLTTLDLDGCSSIMHLPCEIGGLVALEYLSLDGCSSLQHLPSEVGNLTALQTLSLDGCRLLRDLPYKIGGLVALENLSLDGCSSLQHLPSEVGNLTALRTLALDDCTALTMLPSRIGELVALDYFDCKGLSLEHLPREICDLVALKTLVLKRCSRLMYLPNEIGKLTSLESLDLDDCTALTELPFGICGLVGLKHLLLERCPSLKHLPKEIGKLKALKVYGWQHVDGRWQHID